MKCHALLLSYNRLRDCNLDSNAGKLLSTVLDGLHDLRQLE